MRAMALRQACRKNDSGIYPDSLHFQPCQWWYGDDTGVRPHLPFYRDTRIQVARKESSQRAVGIRKFGALYVATVVGIGSCTGAYLSFLAQGASCLPSTPVVVARTSSAWSLPTSGLETGSSARYAARVPRE